MLPNLGKMPADAAGKRVRVKLANGLEPEASWAADGRGACRWSLRNFSFDIAFYEVVA